MSFSPYSGYRGRSVGRIFHYVYEQCGLHYAERVVAGASGLTYNGRPFAIVHWCRWSDDSDVEFPEFKFASEYYGRPSKLSIRPYDNQDDLFREAIHQAAENKKLLKKVAAYFDSGAIVIDYKKPDSFHSALILGDVGKVCKP